MRFDICCVRNLDIEIFLADSCILTTWQISFFCLQMPSWFSFIKILWIKRPWHKKFNKRQTWRRRCDCFHYFRCKFEKNRTIFLLNLKKFIFWKQSGYNNIVYWFEILFHCELNKREENTNWRDIQWWHVSQIRSCLHWMLS